ncbi:MAG: hypothetical protein JRM99_02115 [Nitrososphaerota archaeon]|nr:hypothetical protein [Nitrososphaerota archaeon]MDG7016631.1 hypothetical protein [Nitrososphaerota archaeon]
MSKPKKSHLLRNVVIVLAAIFFSVGAVTSSPAILFFNVTVSGTASAAKAGAVPTGVTFVDENGVLYPAAVGSAGTYSISLQNGHTYLVYVVYGGAGGNCSAGTLNLNALAWTQTLDASC